MKKSEETPNVVEYSMTLAGNDLEPLKKQIDSELDGDSLDIDSSAVQLEEKIVKHEQQPKKWYQNKQEEIKEIDV